MEAAAWAKSGHHGQIQCPYAWIRHVLYRIWLVEVWTALRYSVLAGEIEAAGTVMWWCWLPGATIAPSTPKEGIRFVVAQGQVS